MIFWRPYCQGGGTIHYKEYNIIVMIVDRVGLGFLVDAFSTKTPCPLKQENYGSCFMAEGACEA